MSENHIRVNDLYTLAVDRLAELQPPQNVHFTEYGAEVLAAQVAGCIEECFPDAPQADTG